MQVHTWIISYLQCRLTTTLLVLWKGKILTFVSSYNIFLIILYYL